MKTWLNPAYKPMQFEPPKFAAADKKKERVDPEAGFPWRMFGVYGRQFCKACGQNHPASFVIARSKASADAVFEKGNGLCPTCMCRILINPRERIAVLDGGQPNPAARGAPAGFRPARPPTTPSPYRLWAFMTKKSKPKRCACGGMRWQWYVIAVDAVTAEKRVARYGMCALCTCEYLTFDRFAFQTTDGGPP